MNEVVFADGKMVSTAKAADLSGYSQDYIAQLCRSGSLKCKRIASQWYISTDSLRKYAPHIDDTKCSTVPADNDAKSQEQQHPTKKKAYAVKIADVRSGSFKYDGEEYIPTQDAADLSGYSQDYIGQLARSGEIPARKVGRLWYVAKKPLLQHKGEKDSMLQAVQADASGVRTGDKAEVSSIPIHIEDRSTRANFSIKYIDDDSPLVPSTMRRDMDTENDDSDADGQEIEEVSNISRFGSIQGNIDLKYGSNKENLGYPSSKPSISGSRDTIRSNDSKVTHTGLKLSARTHISPIQVNSISKHPLRAAVAGFTVVVVASGIVASLVYTGAGERIFDPVIAKYGNHLPSRVIEYSN